MQGRGSVTGAYWDDPSLWLVASFIDTFCASLVHRRNSILVRYVYFDHLGPVDISSSIFAVGLVAFDHTKLSPKRVLIVKYRHSCRLSSMVDGRRGRICGSRCVLGSLQNCTFCGQFDYGVTTSSSLGSQEQQ
uniref:Secreted protein n=1 Tax=Ascaris lumbricoides TaxID=6252 RepID=A0A0M3I0K8_ASCLU